MPVGVKHFTSPLLFVEQVYSVEPAKRFCATRYVTEVERSGPQWTEVEAVQKWTETDHIGPLPVHYRSTSFALSEILPRRV